MHNALRDVKRLLHNKRDYTNRMSDPAERLRIARLRAGFETGKEAAEALGVAVSTYLAHENGSRGYPASKAFTYARKFKVREQWLLYGVGPSPGEGDGPKAEVIDMFDHLPPIKQAEALGYLRGLAGAKPE
jgi:transcriptional regulator with XRE-family HTH domain